MKNEYILLNKEYDGESLYDVGRDVHECFDMFPVDKEFLLLKNKDDPDFLAGTFKVVVTYIPDTGDYLAEKEKELSNE